MVQSEHELVVGGAGRDRQADPFDEATQPLFEVAPLGCSQQFQEALSIREVSDEAVKWFAHNPAATLIGIDVVEETQDAITGSGPRRE